MNSNKPFFSIVIPLYNKEKHIQKTIMSVLLQTFQDFEIIVVNDGSQDRSANIIEGLDDKRITLIHQENGGVSLARNKGIKESNADYIVFLDADDIWLPNHLESFIELITRFTTAGLYATAYKVRDLEGKDSDIKIYGMNNNIYSLIPNYFESMANGDNLVWTSAVCIPKTIFENNNIWFPVGEKFGEDQYLWARIAAQFEVAYCKTPSAIYDHGTENNTIEAIRQEIEPHKSFYMIQELRHMIKDKKKIKGFDDYVSKIFLPFPLRSMMYGSKKYGLKQTFTYQLNNKHRAFLFFVFITPRRITSLLKKIRNKMLNKS